MKKNIDGICENFHINVDNNQLIFTIFLIIFYK